MLSQIINFIVETVGQLGYLGIFIMMFLESSFFPFPSEVVMIPAGYLAYKGEMNMYLVILFGILGSLAGAIFNYYFALKLGRRFLMRYGKYILISEDTILKMEEFFNKSWTYLNILRKINTWSCKTIYFTPCRIISNEYFCI